MQGDALAVRIIGFWRSRPFVSLPECFNRCLNAVDAAGVARMECNGIRGNFGHAHQTPDFASLHPGYIISIFSF